MNLFETTLLAESRQSALRDEAARARLVRPRSLASRPSGRVAILDGIAATWLALAEALRRAVQPTGGRCCPEIA